MGMPLRVKLGGMSAPALRKEKDSSAAVAILSFLLLSALNLAFLGGALTGAEDVEGTGGADAVDGLSMEWNKPGYSVKAMH